MRILRYGSRAKIGPGFAFDIVPTQEVTEDHAMFDSIVEAERALIHQTEKEG